MRPAASWLVGEPSLTGRRASVGPRPAKGPPCKDAHPVCTALHPGRLLPGQHRHAGPAWLGLRHQVQVWHVQAADRGERAASNPYLPPPTQRRRAAGPAFAQQGASGAARLLPPPVLELDAARARSCRTRALANPGRRARPAAAPQNGYQAEVPDIWLTNGNPWEVRPGRVRRPPPAGRGAHSRGRASPRKGSTCGPGAPTAGSQHWPGPARSQAARGPQAPADAGPAGPRRPLSRLCASPRSSAATSVTASASAASASWARTVPPPGRPLSRCGAGRGGGGGRGARARGRACVLPAAGARRSSRGFLAPAGGARKCPQSVFRGKGRAAPRLAPPPAQLSPLSPARRPPLLPSPPPPRR
jgi:hypothetical protein